MPLEAMRTLHRRGAALVVESRAKLGPSPLPLPPRPRPHPLPRRSSQRRSAPPPATATVRPVWLGSRSPSLVIGASAGKRLRELVAEVGGVDGQHPAARSRGAAGEG